MEKRWHLCDYVSPAILLIPLPPGCKALLPPPSREFCHLLCAPVVIKNPPFESGSGWRYLKTGRQAEAKAVGSGRVLSGFACWRWISEWLKCIFFMSRRLYAPSLWCTHVTHEAELWGYWDLRTNFSSELKLKKLLSQITAAESIWALGPGWILVQNGGNG